MTPLCQKFVFVVAFDPEENSKKKKKRGWREANMIYSWGRNTIE
jgi:hypothetical protein